jgi:hypothetical protein
MKILLSEEQYIRLIQEESYKWDLEGAKKIIEKYKSINDFRSDYPKIYDAIKSRKLIPELLGHLERGVSYKTGVPVKIGGNVKYDEDELRKIASKYNSVGEFKIKDNKAYNALRIRRPLWDELTSTMGRKYDSKSDEELIAMSKKYGDNFIRIEPKFYADAIRRKLIEPLRRRWTKEEIENIADTYTDLNDFIENENGAYQMALKLGIKDDIIAHMKSKTRNLSFEDLQKMVEPFKHKTQFLKSDPAAYNTASKKGWLDNLKKWEPLGNKFKRLVYAYEFRDKKGNPLAVYVGLTGNVERRDKQHMNLIIPIKNKISPVYKYIVDNKIKPERKILSNGYISHIEAIDMECYYQNIFYKKDKNIDGSLMWQPLHSRKCGGLGGAMKWTEEMLRKEVAKYDSVRDFNRYSPSARHSANRLGIYDDLIKDLVKKGDKGTNNFNQFLNNKNTDISQLDLFSTESFYTRVTPENETKFLKRLKSVINKNKLKLSGRFIENTIRKINPKLYNGLIIHDKRNPNNKWIPYLFPKHTFGIGESKLSFENIISEKLRDMIPSPIYHHTTEERALSIMNSNMLIGTKPFDEIINLDPTLKHSKHKTMVSFTRDKNFIPDASIGNSGDGPRVKPDTLNVIFVGDRNRLKTRYRVVPFDYSILADKAWMDPIPRSRKNPEVEERVLTDRIYPLRQYITNIIYTGKDPEVQKKIDQYLSGMM